jgi:hypothetical protein
MQAVIAVPRWRGALLASVRWIPWAGRRVLDRMVRRLLPGGPPAAGPDDEPGAGVREPRRPGPFAGAGAVALPDRNEA